jgi:hypothetical protein
MAAGRLLGAAHRPEAEEEDSQKKMQDLVGDVYCDGAYCNGGYVDTIHTMHSTFYAYKMQDFVGVGLKPLHWVKVTRAMQGSLWAELQKQSDTHRYYHMFNCLFVLF